MFDSALEAAIRRFQTQHVSYFRSHPADGEVGPSGSTFRALAMPARELGLRAGHPRLFRMLREVAASGATAVVTGLHDGTNEIAAGEPLWGAGPSGSNGVGEVHWEIFSTEPLMGGPDWWAVEDRDEGLTFDSTAVLARASAAAASAGPLDSVLLSAEDVRRLYRTPESRSLRNLQALFRSEWSQDASAYSQLESHGVAGAADLGEQLAPFLWWREASSVLPTTHHVWHYHPLQFLLAYGEKTGAFAGVVVVAVYDETGMPQQGWAVLESLDGTYETMLEPLGPTGAVLSRVPSGPARLRIELFDESEVAARHLNVQVGGVHRAEFQVLRDRRALMSAALRP